MKHLCTRTILMAALLSLCIGCAEEPSVQVYRTEKPAVTDAGQVSPPGPGMGMTADPLQWMRPDFWVPAEPTSSFELMRYQVDAQTTMTVSLVGGSLLANVNRWRAQQLGLDPLAAFDANEYPALTSPAGVILIVDLFADESDPTALRMRTGILPEIANGQPTGRHYYFKMTGPAAEIERQVDVFDEVLRGLRFESDGPVPAEAASETGEPAAGVGSGEPVNAESDEVQTDG